MERSGTDLFGVIEARLGWADRRQAVLAQNVANANTPGYRASDVPPFRLALQASELAMTDPRHMPGPGLGAEGGHDGTVAERSPGGNAVSLEDQMVKVADTAGIQALVLNLHRSYTGMFRTVLGRG